MAVREPKDTPSYGEAHGTGDTVIPNSVMQKYGVRDLEEEYERLADEQFAQSAEQQLAGDLKDDAAHKAARETAARLQSRLGGKGFDVQVIPDALDDAAEAINLEGHVPADLLQGSKDKQQMAQLAERMIKLHDPCFLLRQFRADATLPSWVAALDTEGISWRLSRPLCSEAEWRRKLLRYVHRYMHEMHDCPRFVTHVFHVSAEVFCYVVLGKPTGDAALKGKKKKYSYETHYYLWSEMHMMEMASTL